MKGTPYEGSDMNEEDANNEGVARPFTYLTDRSAIISEYIKYFYHNVYCHLILDNQDGD